MRIEDFMSRVARTRLVLLIVAITRVPGLLTKVLLKSVRLAMPIRFQSQSRNSHFSKVASEMEMSANEHLRKCAPCQDE